MRRIVGGIPDADFVLCIGDDKTDEDMFLALNHVCQQTSPPASVSNKMDEEDENDDDDFEPDHEVTPKQGNGGRTVPTKCFTCVVSRKESAALYSIPTQADVLVLLQELATTAL